MKRILSLALMLFCATSFGATLNPIQLLNPAGSTNGQAIISTGATTAPAWGNVSISTLTGVLPVANGGTGQTSASAALTGLGGLSTATAASTYLTQANAASTYLTQAGAASTYGTKASPLSQFAVTTSAQLAGIISDETGTGSAVFGTSPTITTPSIVGITNASAATAGNVGEGLTTTTSTVSMTSNTATNITTRTLQPGSYIVWGLLTFNPAATTTMSVLQASTSTVSATLGAQSVIQATLTTGAAQIVNTPMIFVNISVATPVYIVAYATFGVSTMTATATINALRIR
jgi:hypothetical protein